METFLSTEDSNNWHFQKWFPIKLKVSQHHPMNVVWKNHQTAALMLSFWILVWILVVGFFNLFQFYWQPKLNIMLALCFLFLFLYINKLWKHQLNIIFLSLSFAILCCVVSLRGIFLLFFIQHNFVVCCFQFHVFSNVFKLFVEHFSFIFHIFQHTLFSSLFTYFLLLINNKVFFYV